MSEHESTMTPQANVAAGSDVFISYSRADRVIAEAVAAGLEARGRSLWVDWEGIPPTAEWMAEIRAGIEAASGVLFLLSPQSARSRVCSEELDYAVAAGKRIVPVVVTDIDPSSVPEEIRRRNWVFARPGDDLEAALDSIGRGLDLDLDGVRLHTRLLVRSREWHTADQDSGRLLRGGELVQAEQWLAGSPTDPAPTAEQRGFVLASRRAATRRQRRFVAVISAALVVALALGAFAFIQRNTAVVSQRQATRVALAADSARLGAQALNVDDPELGLLLAVQGYQLQDSAASRSNLLAALERHDGKLFSVSVGTTVTDITRGLGDRLNVVDYRGTPYAWSTTTHARLANLGPGAVSDWYVTSADNRSAVINAKPFAPVGPVWVTADDGTKPDQWHRLPLPAKWDTKAAWAGPRLLTAGPAHDGNPGDAVQLSDPDHPDRPPVIRHLGGDVRFLAGSKTVAVAATTGDVHAVFLMDPRTLAIRRKIHVPRDQPVSAVAISADGSYLALGYDNGRVEIDSPAAPNFGTGPGHYWLDHSAGVSRLAFSPDGSQLADAGYDGRVIVYRSTDGLRIRWFELGAPVNGLTWDRLGQALYAATFDGQLSGFDVTTGHALASFVGGSLPIVEDGTVAAAGDGSEVVTVGTHWTSLGSEGGAGMGALAMATGTVRHALIPPRSGYADLRLIRTGDGSTAVTVSKGGTVATRWDLRTMTRTSVVKFPTVDRPSAAHRPRDSIDPRIPYSGLLHPASADISNLLLTPHGRGIAYLMAAGNTQLLRGLNIRPFTVQADLPLQSRTADGRAWRPIGWADKDGRTLIASCGIGCIARIDTASGAVTKVSDPGETRGVPGDGLAVSTTAMTSDRTRAVQGVNDGTFRLYGGPHLTPITPWVRTESASVVSSTFVDDGALLVTGGKDGSLAFWRAKDGAPVASRFQVGFRQGEAIGVAALPGGRVLALDGVGTAWSIPATVDGWKALACRVAGRNLTPTEWREYLQGRPYQRTCA